MLSKGSLDLFVCQQNKSIRVIGSRSELRQSDVSRPKAAPVVWQRSFGVQGTGEASVSEAVLLLGAQAAR
jgi:hypothetical protein